ncbi:non-hydrolyzing UDP-N-acetylglucosamine 2-epimerase [Tautonia rosea]|uniref:non-hydrolyzing UDP-N-acetylglucosamine 2-epimerase n=1 Tax=Tautonia rosea TaxID=2728037 RepID=UPI001474A6E3|nr:UDP-N-acetylglucosamine 2-epimerase (non-hydrolyzing) [Tautonia rosea]
MSRTVACVVGTRPEAVKMAPVILKLRQAGAETGLQVRVVSTGQHRELLDRALADFSLQTDDDLALMRPGQDLVELTSRCLMALGHWLDEHRPDLLIAQGDTTTVFASALACHYRHVPFVHIEAGLRSGSLAEPFPEESNRILTARLADLHFAPSDAACANLLREGIPADRIRVVGNTVIDALRWIEARPVPLPVEPSTDRMILMTAHRRENLGLPLVRACRAVAKLLQIDTSLCLVFPVHPNPDVRSVVSRELGELDRVHLIEPVNSPQFVALMKAARLILSDSGGVQEEAPALGRPVLVLRDRTERPEAVEQGSCRLVGTDPNLILTEALALLSPTAAPLPPCFPYGDGFAADRIVRTLADRFHVLDLDPNAPSIPPLSLAPQAA